MISYLKNTEGYKMEFFKGKTYDQILPIFQARFDANMKFLFKTKEEMEKEDDEIIKSINETPTQKAAKRRKLTTPLAQKVPVVDYQKFFDPIFKEEILAFMSDLGYPESEAYKTYYAFATGKEIPKPNDDEDDDDATSVSKDEDDNDQENDDDQEDDDDQGDDDGRTDSINDGDDFVHPKFLTHDQDERQDEEDSFDPRVQTPSLVETTDDEDNDEENQDVNVEGDELDEEETNE
uniref:Uncharacterized protein n=1 Tax=Tanacetum cinerariifolium TaxID=118510 RepID=A0A6L2NKB9_TANCI|nr:hypothetical protein [Tanacetum cinerariifolium]